MLSHDPSQSVDFCFQSIPKIVNAVKRQNFILLMCVCVCVDIKYNSSLNVLLCLEKKNNLWLFIVCESTQ